MDPSDAKFHVEGVLLRVKMGFQKVVESTDDALTLRIFCPRLFNDLDAPKLLELRNELAGIEARWTVEAERFSAGEGVRLPVELMEVLYSRGRTLSRDIWTLLMLGGGMLA